MVAVLDVFSPLASLIVAAAASAVALRGEWRARRERAETVARQVSAQAEKVCAWLVREAPGDPHYDGPDGWDDDARHQVVIYIENRSDLPVYNVRVDWYPSGVVDAMLAENPDLLDGDHYDVDLHHSECVWVMDVLPPRTRRRYVVDVAEQEDPWRQPRLIEQSPSTSIGFDDTAGLRWFRDYGGRLHRSEFRDPDVLAGTLRGQLLDAVSGAGFAVARWAFIALGGVRAQRRAAAQPRCPRL